MEKVRPRAQEHAHSELVQGVGTVLPLDDRQPFTT